MVAQAEQAVHQLIVQALVGQALTPRQRKTFAEKLPVAMQKSMADIKAVKQGVARARFG